MSKEMMIVFLYDTECCQQESDDPVSAVLYFHPSWVSDVQKLLLCGQLMGTTHFLSETFSKPKIISLQSGKFALKMFGRFILAVGTDRNICESILEYRSNLLSSLIQLYHYDINDIHFHSSKSEQHRNLSEKLYHVFETYLPQIQCHGSIFQSFPSVKLPKSASNVYLESNQILESLQHNKGILGGVILYQNKMVASQLSPALTKTIISSEPYRIKSASEVITLPFHIPIGVQLINVYISSTEYSELTRSSNQSQSIFSLSNKSVPLPFQIRKKSISKDAPMITTVKRDKSIIFAHIPEEESVDYDESKISSFNKKVSHAQKSRPTYLPLKFKNLNSKDVTESGFNSINFDETDSFPNFIGKTSVCSTPMTENKLLNYGNILSICATNENVIESLADTAGNPQSIVSNISNEISEKDASTNQCNVGFNTKKYQNFNINPYKQIGRCNSMTNINIPPMVVGRFTIRSVNCDDKQDNSDENVTSNLKVEDIYYDVYRTLSDPIYPLFNSNGLPFSISLFQEFLDYQYKDLEEEIKIPLKQLPLVNNEKANSKCENSSIEIPDTLVEDPILNNNKIKTNRKSLYLPLKALNCAVNNAPEKNKQSNIFDSPAQRKKITGLQLTPLMNKLTMLAMCDEHSSGFSSWDTTPGYNNLMNVDYMPKRRKSKDTDAEKCIESENVPTVKVELFICGQQNTTLILLLEEKSSEKQELIQSLFETCVSKLTRIESNLHQVMNINVEGLAKGEGDYSFICLDSKWDTVNRCGPWSSHDLLSLERIHNDFTHHPMVTEITTKVDDGVLYGYRCGKSEIFYHETSYQQTGLPPPQDAMGTVSLCAKRRLERDHSIILL